MEKLYNETILEKIVNNNLNDYELEIIEVNLWWLSQFEMKKKFIENKELCLRIQKYYIYIFNKYF